MSYTKDFFAQTVFFLPRCVLLPAAAGGGGGEAKGVITQLVMTRAAAAALWPVFLSALHIARGKNAPMLVTSPSYHTLVWRMDRLFHVLPEQHNSLTVTADANSKTLANPILG